MSLAAPTTTTTRAVRVGRIVVVGVAAVLLVGFVLGLVVWATHATEVLTTWAAPDGWSDSGVRAVLAGWGVPVGWYVAYFMALDVFLVAVSVVTACFVLRNAVSWFRLYLVLVLILFATAGGGVPLVVGAAYPALGAPAELVQGIAWIALFPMAYVFPDGRFVPRWTRWFAAGWAIWLTVVVATDSTGEGPLGTATLLLLFASCVVAPLYRYLRVAGPLERLQMRWLMLAIGLRFAFHVAVVGTPLGRLRDETTSQGLALYTGLMLVSYLVAAALPVAITAAVLRYRLFDVDVVISRTLVYGVLTALVVGTYALVVEGVGTLWRGGSDVALPLVATGLVAVAFSPARERVQQRVNRFVYGEAHDPYGVLSRLGRQLAAVVQPEEVAPTIVTTVARALRAPYAAISLASTGTVVASTGAARGATETFPLLYRGRVVGALEVGCSNGEDRLPGTDRRLLTDLTHHCGAALYAAQESLRLRRLAADLQATREQLVSAREEERRRIRRDLHDSLGPALGSQALTIDAARALVPTDPAAADDMLRDLKAHSQEALAEVRRLARRLRPPVLDDLGLATALRHMQEEYERHGLQVTVDVPVLPGLPAAVEVAVYRIVHEALTNVVRHAGARECRVEVAVSDEVLEVDITDDGHGIHPGAPAGVGTSSMRERTEELGGQLRIGSADGSGTRVNVRFPLHVERSGQD